MEAIEENIHKFYEEWEYYCYPDKTDKCRTQVDSYLKEIDKLQEEISTLLSMQMMARKKKRLSCFISKGKYSIFYQPIKKRQNSFYIRAYITYKEDQTQPNKWRLLEHFGPCSFQKGWYRKFTTSCQHGPRTRTLVLIQKGKNKVSLRYQSVLLRCKASNTKNS